MSIKTFRKALKDAGFKAEIVTFHEGREEYIAAFDISKAASPPFELEGFRRKGGFLFGNAIACLQIHTFKAE